MDADKQRVQLLPYLYESVFIRGSTEMSTRNRRSGLSLVLLGLAGVLFFWITDRGYGWWSDASTIDQANQALAGTVIGVVGSLTVLAIGLWLLTRKVI